MAGKKKYGVDAVNSFTARLQEAQQLEEQATQPEPVVAPKESAPPSTARKIEEPASVQEHVTIAPSPAIEQAQQTETSQAIKQETPEPQRRALVVPPPKKETRSNQIILRVRPSLKTRIEALCKKHGISLSEAINQLFEAWLSENE
jgi:predicted HicB family RNase H-like nuclease